MTISIIEQESENQIIHIGGVMKLLLKIRKKPAPPQDDQQETVRDDINIKILDTLIEDLFEIDDDRAAALLKKSR